MKLLFIGDVVGRPGREVLENNLPLLEQEFGVDFTIINGENASGGFGMDLKAYDMMSAAGADAFTMGNHTFDNRKIFDFIDRKENIVRPLNLTLDAPGQGIRKFELKNGESLVIINFVGRAYSKMSLDCPFRKMEDILKDLSLKDTAIFVDFHGEATSEKQAFANYADGRVSAVVGTHTHVQTNDDRILPGGTAYITDAGCVSAEDSVLGVVKEAAIEKQKYLKPVRFSTKEGGGYVCGIFIETDADGKAVKTEKIKKYAE